MINLVRRHRARRSLTIGTGVAACVAAVAALSMAQAQAPAQTGDNIATRIITLGTGGGPIARAKRSESATLVQVGSHSYLIDAGAGVSHQLAASGFAPSDVHHIFLTHLHFDHVAGLAPLLGFGWANGNKKVVDIYGPPGTAQFLSDGLKYLSIPEGIFRAQMAPSPSISDLSKAHDVDITKPTVIYQDEQVRVTAVENSHFITIPVDRRPLGAKRAYSYRFDTPDRSIVITGDTGPSDAVVQLAKGADVLISEVLDWDDATSIAMQKKLGVTAEQFKATTDHMLEEHLSPAQVGKLAAQAGVKMVILSHVGMGGDSETDMRHYTQGVRSAYSGPVVIARDGDEF